MRSVYPGVDVLFYGTDRHLEYDFVVAPGASPQQIVMAFDGAEGITRTASGDLAVTVAGRDLTQRRPVAYQHVGGTRVPVSVEYVVYENTARLGVGDYDRTRPLVIDPVLSYSTYFGASDRDEVRALTVDGSGNLYVAGYANEADFPIASLRPHGGPSEWRPEPDGYVAKFRPDGTPVWLTFLGGSGADQAFDVASGPGGDVFVTGFTASTNFPTTAGAYDSVGHNAPTEGSVPGDAFVVRLAADGATMIYGTYLGGGEFWGGDSAAAIAVDAQGRAHVVGETGTRDFPVTVAASRGTELPNYYNREAFVAKFSADGSRLEWSRLLSGFDWETAADVMLDQNGGIFVVGSTSSVDFPVRNAVQPTKYGPNGYEGEQGHDGFLTHLWTDGSIVYSTYLGGAGEDDIHGIARGQFDRIYVVGTTTSETLAGAMWARRGGPGDPDGFIMQIVPNATSVVATRFTGGAAPDALFDVSVDRAYNVWVVGSTQSTNLSPTLNAPQKTYGGGHRDAFIEQWQADLWGVGLSTYLGGAADDGAWAVTVDRNGNAYVAGGSASENFPTRNALQPSLKPAPEPFYRADGFIAKFACTVTVFGTSQNVGAAAGTGSVNIHPESGCTPVASSTVAWLRITTVDADSVDYAFDGNTSGSPRTATLNISGTPFTVTQAGTTGSTPPASSNTLEHVLSPAFARVITGTWKRPTDADGGSTNDLTQADAGVPKINTALANPSHYFELTFHAEAGRPYRLWIRGKAQGDYWGNDSVFVQFSGSVDSAGNAINRIGTTSATAVNLEECSGCGLSGWGWEDNGWGSRGLPGPEIRFAASGPQTIRIQQREDGFRINQIVLSAERYLRSSPGLTKNDTTQLQVTNAPSGTTETEPTTNLREIVLYANDAKKLSGAWSLVTDATAAARYRAFAPNAGAPKLNAPLAAPNDYVEFAFNAEAGRAYRVWLRMKADGDYWGNDSVWLQFSGAVDESGAAINRIGTVSGTSINLEECSGCGLNGWGWQDDGYGARGQLGNAVRFAASGQQVIRIQTREDGVSIDQVVISAERYFNAAPGAAKQDVTIVPK